jgi:hypothetical protein
MVTLLDATGPTWTSIAIRLLRGRSSLAVSESSRRTMDETPEPASDPPRDDPSEDGDVGGDRPRRSSTRRRRIPAGASGPAGRPSGDVEPPALRATATARTNGRGTPPPRRWWEQPWVWLGAVVLVVVVAVGVSLLVNSDPTDIKPVGDTTAFCGTVADYKQLLDDANTTNASSTADSRKLRAQLGQMQQASPAEIRPTVDEIAVSLDQIIDAQSNLRTEGTDLITNLQTADSILSGIDLRTAPASDRLSRYIQRACGIDMNASVPSSVTTTTADPGAPASSTAPS